MSGIVSGQQIKIPNGETAPAAKWVSLNTSSQRLVGMRSARSRLSRARYTVTDWHWHAASELEPW